MALWDTSAPSAAKILPVVIDAGDCSAVRQSMESIGRAGADLAPLLLEGLSAGFDAMLDCSKLVRRAGKDQFWICPIAAGDTLAPDALAIYAAAIRQNPLAKLIYADDDLMTCRGRATPHFKPDWNGDLFQHHDFVTEACVIRVEGAAGAGTSCSLRMLLRAALADGPDPVHLPLVLHHRQRRPEPRLPSEPRLRTSGVQPSATVVIPTRNKADLLRTCLEGLGKTEYEPLQTIVVDNGSADADALSYLHALEQQGVTVLRLPGPFNFSALNNAAVRHATGDLLCFLNNDVEMLAPNWLRLLAAQAVRPEIGAVGARLLYPDRTIQHAGVVTGIGGGAGHAHRYVGEDECGYFQRARLPQLVSAVTGACLVVSREKFLAVGGFDEVDFPVAFNDVDLCLKLNARGWQSFYEPRATLIHHESKSRGSDVSRANRARFAGELEALKRKWHTDRKRDRFHHPHLSPFTEQFLISV